MGQCRNAMTDRSEVTAPARHGLRAVVARRWPTGLALLVSLPGFADAPSPSGTAALARAMLLLPLWYVVVGAVARRRWTWYVLIGGIGLFVLLRLQDR